MQSKILVTDNRLWYRAHKTIMWLFLVSVKLYVQEPLTLRHKRAFPTGFWLPAFTPYVAVDVSLPLLS